MNTMHERNMQQVTSQQRVAKIIVKIFVYAFLLLMAAAVLFPFYWMIISSLKSMEEYRQSVPTFWGQKVGTLWRYSSTLFKEEMIIQ